MNNLKKTFNSTTTTGRANVAKVTYASFAFLYLYYRFFKKSQTPDIKAHDKSFSHEDHDDENNYEDCQSCSESASQEPLDDDHVVPESAPCWQPPQNPFPNHPPTACPPNCEPTPPPNLPEDEGQCTCRFIRERECLDPEARKLNPFLNDVEDYEVW